MPNGRIALAASLLLAASLAIAGDDRAELVKAGEELRLLEADLELLRREIPPEFDAAETKASLRDMADVTGIQVLEISAGAPAGRLPLPGGAPSRVELHAVDIEGRGRWQDVEWFFRLVDAWPRPARVEAFVITAVADGTIAFEARLMLPSFGAAEIERASSRAGVLSALRTEIDRARGLKASLGDYLHGPRVYPLSGLANVGAALAEAPVAITAVRFEGDLTVRGLLAGSRARDDLIAAVEKGPFAIERKEFARAGRCESFSLSLKAKPTERVEVEGYADPFDGGADAFCREGYDAPVQSIVARGSAGEAPPAFRFRDVPLKSVFFILNDLIAYNFVVDGDVAGRISLDVLEGASVEETLAAIESAGVVIGSGSVKRVSRTKQPPIAEAGGGEPVNFQLHDADVSDVLCLIGTLSEREFRVPRGMRARVSVFATEEPLRNLERAVLAAAGLTATESGGVVSARAAGSSSPLASACENGPPSSRLRKGYPVVAAADVELAGLARVGDSYRAYLYGPGGRIEPVETGSELFDAKVASVGADGVVLVKDGGALMTVPWR